MYLGCQLSSAGGYEKMGKEALSIGANTFAFFTRNPRGGKAKAVNIDDISSLNSILKEHNFGPLVSHAPYTVNPCSKNPAVREFAEIAFREDLERLELLPGNYYNFHPGSHTSQGTELGIKLLIEFLNIMLWEDQKTVVLIETMSGKGSEIGKTIEEINEIISKVILKDKVGVCLDTCHIFDGGYDIVNSPRHIIEEFDKIIGIDKLKALHVNDSKNELGSKKDRHAKIGEGNIGAKGIIDFLSLKEIENLPCVLETPQEDIYGYGQEIAWIRKELEKASRG